MQPKNIIVDRHNHITIIDFDIARIRKEEADSDTEFLGTVGYASPEQFGFGPDRQAKRHLFLGRAYWRYGQALC
ncbi:MAG: hypothetical protein ACLUR5_18750 [Eubacterium ventriosum]